MAEVSPWGKCPTAPNNNYEQSSTTIINYTLTRHSIQITIWLTVHSTLDFFKSFKNPTSPVFRSRLYWTIKALLCSNCNWGTRLNLRPPSQGGEFYQSLKPMSWYLPYFYHLKSCWKHFFMLKIKFVDCKSVIAPLYLASNNFLKELLLAIHTRQLNYS